MKKRRKTEMTIVGNAEKTAQTEAVAADADAMPQETTEQVSEETKEPKNVFDDIGSDSDASEVSGRDEIERDSALPGATLGNVDERTKINGAKYSKAELVITPEEKAAFLEALVTGERYRQTYSLFGGKVIVTIRSRTSAETHAMYSYIRHVLSTTQGEGVYSRIEGDMAYVPLVVQIEELNGVRYPEMTSPLTYEQRGEDIVEPGWYKDFLAWKSKPEGLTSALISYIQLFEYKYWTMTKEAGNKNFWTTDTSTEV